MFFVKSKENLNVPQGPVAAFGHVIRDCVLTLLIHSQMNSKKFRVACSASFLRDAPAASLASSGVTVHSDSIGRAA